MAVYGNEFSVLLETCIFTLLVMVATHTQGHVVGQSGKSILRLQGSIIERLQNFHERRSKDVPSAVAEFERKRTTALVMPDIADDGDDDVMEEAASPQSPWFPFKAPPTEERAAGKLSNSKRRHDESSSHLTMDVDLTLSACPSSASWRALRTALDINNTAVVVYQPSPDGSTVEVDWRPRQDNEYTDVLSHGGTLMSAAAHDRFRSRDRVLTTPQWFYTVTCRNDVMPSKRDCNDCCIGVDHIRYHSTCQQKRSYVLAYASRLDNRARRRHYDWTWTWIQINSSCGCAVTPRALRPVH